ncbi:MAG: tetratricopeptide repeat protein [Actinomycetota bacterium]|nr:tetratricopeptide repeat protein [Actinomycetota bacterium]
MSTPALDQALALKRSGDFDGAVIALEGILSRSPSHPVALAQLAEVQLKRGRLEEAAGALDRAEAAAGTTRFTARLRGDLSYKAGRWKDAARHYQDASALGDDGPWPLVQLARCRLRVGDLDGARGTAAQAVERDPTAAAAWVVLGDIALREERLDDAEAMYARAHEQAPDDQWAYAKLVEARLLRLPPDGRERQVQVLLKTAGRDNRHLLGVLARLRSQQGDDEEAARAWGRRARAGDLFARKQEGFALRKAGKLEEAAAVLGACLAADPEDRYVFSSYVSLQRERAAFEELRRTLEEALPRAGSRRGAFYGALRKLPAADTAP